MIGALHIPTDFVLYPIHNVPDAISLALRIPVTFPPLLFWFKNKNRILPPLSLSIYNTNNSTSK